MLTSSSYLRYERDRVKARNSLAVPQALPLELQWRSHQGLEANTRRCRPSESSEAEPHLGFVPEYEKAEKQCDTIIGNVINRQYSRLQAGGQLPYGPS